MVRVGIILPPPILGGPAKPNDPVGNAVRGALEDFLHALTDLMGQATNVAGDVIGGFLGAMEGVVKSLGVVLVQLLTAAGFGEHAKNIDLSGDMFAFLGSISSTIVDEKRLTSGPLSFAEVLQYKDRIEGMRTALVLISFVFSIAVELVTLGQVGRFTGVLIHMVDDLVGDHARIVSTQLVRRAVGDPLGEGYKEIHRTGRLSTSELEKAYAAVLTDDEELVAGLAKDGFDDRAIEVKGQLAAIDRFRSAGIEPIRRKTLSLAQNAQLLKAGLISEELFVRRMVDLGYGDEEITQMLELVRLKETPPPPTTGP